MKLQVRTMNKILVGMFILSALIIFVVVEYNLILPPAVKYYGKEEMTTALCDEMDRVNAFLEPYNLCFSDYGQVDIDGIYAAEMESVLQIDENTEMVLKLRFANYRKKDVFATPEYTLWIRRTKDVNLVDASFLDAYPYFYEIATHLSGILSKERFRTYCESAYEDVYAELEQNDSDKYDVFGQKEKHLPSLLKRSGYVDFTIQRASEYGEEIYLEHLGNVTDSVPIDAYEKTLLISDYWRSQE